MGNDPGETFRGDVFVGVAGIILIVKTFRGDLTFDVMGNDPGKISRGDVLLASWELFFSSRPSEVTSPLVSWEIFLSSALGVVVMSLSILVAVMSLAAASKPGTISFIGFSYPSPLVTSLSAPR